MLVCAGGGKRKEKGKRRRRGKEWREREGWEGEEEGGKGKDKEE